MIKGVPELAKDHGRSYEMKHWDDVERAIMADGTSRGSEEAILEVEDETATAMGLKSFWKRMTSGDLKAQAKEDMTITRTSEVELQIEPASGQNSKRSSRRPQARTPTKP